MPITEQTAHVGCPYFAGVSGDTTINGFVIALPKDEFLTCTPNNISAERGILSVFNYDLAKSARADAADRTAFLVYTKAGSDAANATTGRMLHALDVLMEVDYDYEVTTNLRNADARGARIQVYGHEDVSGVCTGAYINCQLQGGFTFNGRYLEGTSSYGGIALDIRVETTGSGTVTCNNAMTGIFIGPNIRNAFTGNLYGIAINKPYEGGAVSGSTVGIMFVSGNVFTGETDYDTGIDLADECLTGLDVGACTTAIALTGAATTGINITGSMTDGIKIQTGTFTDAIEIAGTTTNGINIGPCSGAGITFAGMTSNAANIILGGYGRISTSTIAGAVLDWDTSYTYSEGLELRYGVTNWTGTGNSVKGVYFRMEGKLGNASGGVRGAEVFGVCNITSLTTGLNQVQGLYSSLLIKSPSSSFTIGGNNAAIEANFSYEASTGGAQTTFTNNISCLFCTPATATGMADYTKVCGIIIRGGDADATRIFGNAIEVSNHPSGYSNITWTNGISLAGTYTTPINLGTLTPSSTCTSLINAVVSGTTAIKGIYFEITSTKTSSSLEGIRAEAICDAASGTASIRGGNFKANINASKVCSYIEGVLAHGSVAEGGATVITLKGLGVLVSSGATFNATNVYGATINVHTRGDETIATDDVILRLENEAVDGAGRMMDSAIQVVDTNVSGDAATCLIDASGFELETHTDDQVRLLKFKNSAGTTVTMSYDTSAGDIVFA